MVDCGKIKKWMAFFTTIRALEFALEIGIINAILEGYSKHSIETQTIQKT